MKIHEILDACLEYVAIEGVLGKSLVKITPGGSSHERSNPVAPKSCRSGLICLVPNSASDIELTPKSTGSDIDTLRTHLTSLDSSIDDSFFEYVYGLLIAHPSIQVILTAHPLPPPEGTVRVGTAPLPQDGITQSLAEGDDTADGVLKDNVRGRELAFQLAGKEFRSSKEAMKDKRDEQEKARQKRKAAQMGEDGAVPDGDEPVEDLWTEIVEDDGGQEGDRVLKSDLPGLSAKWGSRLRIRATDDEIYYRLVGQTERVGQIRYSLAKG